LSAREQRGSAEKRREKGDKKKRLPGGRVVKIKGGRKPPRSYLDAAKDERILLQGKTQKKANPVGERWLEYVAEEKGVRRTS